ncbi:MAG TPA: hypothetical protein VNN73_20535 [Blastocatellia bacterium]|nr:hypothetical protein [Blastocatellia bacterium]
MLSIGREINISQKEVVCRKCHWEGAGSQLSIGLIEIAHTQMYLAAYRCPQCHSFDVNRKGKLLEFRLPRALDYQQTDAATRDENSNENESRKDRGTTPLWR